MNVRFTIFFKTKFSFPSVDCVISTGIGCPVSYLLLNNFVWWLEQSIRTTKHYISWTSATIVVKRFFICAEMVSPDVFNQVFRPIIFVFRLAGLWPSGNRTLIYIVYGTAFFFIFSFALTVSELVQLIKFTESANLTQNMFMTLTDLAVLLKFVNFYWRWHSMQELYETARDFERETVAEVKLFNKRMRFNYWIVLLLFISVNTAHAGAELKTIWSPDLLLPFPAWYPPSWLDGGVMYWLTYAHNSLSHLIGSNLVSAIDGFPTSLLFMVSVQMEILGSRLKSLGDDGPLTHTGHLKNGESRMRNLQCRKRIIKCIQTHQQILELSICHFEWISIKFYWNVPLCRFTKKIENNFTMPLLAEICVSGTVSCCLIGEVAIVSDFSKNIFMWLTINNNNRRIL